MQSNIIKKEIKRVNKKYSNNFYSYKNDLSESVPSPAPLSFDILKQIYSPGGPLSEAFQKLGFYYNKKNWQKNSYIETIFG